MWNGNLKAAVTNLRVAKWRSFLTMLGIIIGVSSVVSVVSLSEGLKHQIVGQIDNLGSNVITVRPGKLVSGRSSSLNFLAFANASTLTTKDATSVEKVPGVAAVAPIDFVSSTASNDGKELDNIYVVGTQASFEDISHQKVAYGEFFGGSEGAVNQAVIGADIAQSLFSQLNPVGQSFSIGGQSFIVRGVLAPSSGGLFNIAQTDYNSAIFIPMSSALALANGNTNVLQILVKVTDSAQVDSVIAASTKAIAANHGTGNDFTVLKQYQLLDLANGAVNNIARFIVGIAAISLLVGGIGIMDIMLVSVSERTREIGIRKALGATNGQILQQFLVEGLALTISGGVFGLIISVVVYAFLRIQTHLRPDLSWGVMALALVVSVVVGVIFSTIPALKAARKDPIVALRGE